MSTPKRILLFVTGLSPQVVTETLYALATDAQSPWIPDEIHVITTREGAERVRLALLSEEPAWFARLIEDYDLPAIRFDEEHIHVLKCADGSPMVDVRTPEDNEQAANQITEWVRKFTAEEGSELHASIAGGRKTLGYYLGYALSLFGRPQDRLSHVLVSEPFESCWNFFYPTPYSSVIETRNQALADTRDARVDLAEIPFVRLRQGMDENLLNGKAGFVQAVQAAQRVLEPPCLRIDPAGQCIEAGGQRIELPPRELAFYRLFARRAKNAQPRLHAPAKGTQSEDWRDLFLREYKTIRSGELDDLERTEKALEKGMDADYFSECKSKLHKKLKLQLGPSAQHYLIDDGGTRPGRFGLDLPAEAIEFVRLDPPTE